MKSLLVRGRLTHYRQLLRLLSRPALLLLISISFASTSHAQASDQDKQLAAIMSVINSYLLIGREEPIARPIGTAVELDLNELVNGTFQVSNTQPVFAQFELQDQAIELCFDLTSSNANNADISVAVNGEPALGVIGKDNCYLITEPDQRLINYIVISTSTPGVTISVSRVELAATAQSVGGFNRLTRGQWNERAVRKVLKIFAFGGHARDAQIRLWADLDPELAIVEMLNFDKHNLKLSPLAVGENYTETTTEPGIGTLLGFQNYLSSSSSNLPIPVANRTQYGLNGYNFDDAYGRMITVRGLNPFRQRIGFWETNYHLAVNRDASVDRDQIAAYYDIIMDAHESGIPYHQVMGVAAKSAAVAEQYGHDRNQWVYDRNLDDYICKCNDDFAREIHQLFYGIFGVDDPHHEDGTIRETSKMLTDMPIDNTDGPNDNIAVVFGTSRHHTDDLTILGHTISGTDASQKIDNLMPISIMHPESLKNLPVMIISVLADDNMSDAKADKIRAAWAGMGQNKVFLDFIRAYAISTLFHSKAQFKYFTSHERALYMANKHNLDNLEAFFGGASYSGRAGKSVGSVISDDAAGEFFRPLHNVFGAQTSYEASDSALAFENNFNLLTDDEYRIRDAVSCSSCDQGQPWEKKWSTVLPRRADNQFYVADVAAWLWNHAVGNFDNYTELEKAHLYSFLGAARNNPNQTSDGDYAMDFNLLMCMAEDYKVKEETNSVPLSDMLYQGNWDNYCRQNDDDVSGYSSVERAALNRVYSGQQIMENPTAQDLLSQLGNMTLPLETTDGSNGGAELRKHARERISNALGFIFTTPFVFAEGQ
ncbi:DUF1800 family protein [Arenicella xantha]|uniref:Uncharacterized protein DUF1800 n=1 Tax=Arenicella xantha TaxID=644221 RepID=A0A395JQ13_9GAMM|nr:DUF1800 family protein [Arenicella xantha]RBP53744.1 uncharacterized protein DUF1800 [Arenicella xantha]